MTFRDFMSQAQYDALMAQVKAPVPAAVPLSWNLPLVWLLIGEGETGKSSTVRALTGSERKRSGGWRIGTRDHGEIEIALFIHSASEQGLDVDELLHFVEHDVEADFLLLPLRLKTMPGTHYTGWLHFASTLHRAGWHIERPVVLGQEKIHGWESIKGIPEPYCLPDATLPTNVKAAVCRQIWGWF